MFHPKLADFIAPLRVLCNKGALHGRAHCKKHFEAFIKKKSQVHKCWEILTSQSQVSSNQNASKNGLGTFLLQDGKTIVYALRSLTVQWYSNIEKDGLQPTEKRSVQRMAYCLKATG